MLRITIIALALAAGTAEASVRCYSYGEGGKITRCYDDQTRRETRCQTDRGVTRCHTS
jgi:hypothetical protein